LTVAVDTLASLAWSDVHVACDEDRKAKLDNDVPHLALNSVAAGGEAGHIYSNSWLCSTYPFGP
jgi:hypothetical protein